MRKIKVLAVLAMAASVIGAYAQSTNATPDPAGDFVMQGDFADSSPTVFLTANPNRDRIGTGGGTQRMNQPIVGFALPNIPAGETIQTATFTFKMAADAVVGNPLPFEMVVCMLDATNSTHLTALGTTLYTDSTNAVNSTLNQGIVIAQLADTDVANGGTTEITLTGAALTQLSGLYNASGVPSQTHVFFRMSHSTPVIYPAFNNKRFQTDDAGVTVIRSLNLSWSAFPSFAADPVVKASTTWGTDYSTLSQTLDGSATASDGTSTIYYEKTGGPAWLNVASNGALTGIADTLGTNEFPIRAFIGDNEDTATLKIVVDALGDAPVFTTDPITKADAVISSDYASLSQSLTNSATDVNGDTLTYSRTGGPGWLVVASNGALSGVCNVLGTNTFSVKVDDGNGNSDTATLEIFAPVVGNPPIFTLDTIVKADGAFEAEYGDEAQTLAGEATDVDGDTLTYSYAGSGWLNVASNGALSGVCTIAGTNSFTVTVDDGYGNTDTTTLLIYVEPAPVGELIVGIDTFDSTTAPSVTYTISAGTTNISATATASATGNWSTGETSGRGSSKDGTWGNHVGPPAASTVTSTTDANFTLTNAKTDGEVTLSITNSGTAALELGAFHMDALAFRPKAARTYALNVLSGSDITVGNVFTSASQAITHLGGGLLTDDNDPLTHDQHDDIDISMADLADNVLEAGEVAIIQIAFSGGAGDGSGGHHLFVDNIGISIAPPEGTTPEDPDPPVMNSAVSGGNVTISWTSDADFKLQTRESLTAGTWTDVPGATSSPVVVPMTNDVEFLQLIHQP